MLRFMQCITLIAQHEFLVTPKLLPVGFSTFHDASVLLLGSARLPKLGAIPFLRPYGNFIISCSSTLLLFLDILLESSLIYVHSPPCKFWWLEKPSSFMTHIKR